MKTVVKILKSITWIVVTLLLIFIGAPVIVLIGVVGGLLGGIVFFGAKFFLEVCIYGGNVINEAILLAAVMMYDTWKKEEEAERHEELGEEFSVKRA